jgi:hypothetical protein
MFCNRSDTNFIASGDEPGGAQHTHTQYHQLKFYTQEPNTRIAIAAITINEEDRHL